MVHFLQSRRAGRHFNRGQGQAAQQQFEAAAHEYDQALALDPNLPHLALHYALLEADRGHFERAQGFLQQALEEQPENPVYHTFQGWLWAEAGSLEEAQQSWRRARALVPDNKLTLNGEAYLLFRQGHPAEGVARLQQDGLCSNHAAQARLLVEVEKAWETGALRIAPPSGSAKEVSSSRLPGSARRCLRQGVKGLEKGRPTEAVAWLERAQELNPRLPDLRLLLGAAYYEAGRYPEAQEVLEAEERASVQAEPTADPQAQLPCLYLAATHLRQGCWEAAEPYLKNAPEGADTDYCQGLAALLQGQERTARQQFSRALAQDGSLLQRRLADFAVH